MWNFSLLKALVVWGKLGPLLLVRLGVFTAVALVLAVAIAIGVWLGVSLRLAGGAQDRVIGGLAGIAVAALVLAFLGRAFRQGLQIRMIALIADLLDGVRVPLGQGQTAHARASVAARFGSPAQASALYRYVRGVARKVPDVAEGVGPILSLPLFGRLVTGGLVNQAVLAHAYRARPENAWEAAHDGLVLTTQNARELLGAAGRINAVGWALALAIFLVLLPPFVGLLVLWPAAGAISGVVAAALAALAIRSALIQPFALACLWQAFLRTTAGQEPLGEWRGRLTQISTPFRDLGDRAVAWVPETAPVA
jgi:hypothetical protein